ncbi:MAG: (deoxy)nucleoside triphosphate pyrophosphohydrolase [Proteobacteria bacterium]|nr:(deoxy)nucleoside triphosphate pyrophosphohydrolase [Pseudomonadota bacterium]
MNLNDIPVSCAVIRRGPHYLAVQRSAIMREPLHWEFPGGKIEAGESAYACLHRELDEELGISVDIRGFLGAFVHPQGAKRIVLLPFLCTLRQGKLELREHSASTWMTLPELARLTWCTADLGILKQLGSPALEETKWWSEPPL